MQKIDASLPIYIYIIVSILIFLFVAKLFVDNRQLFQKALSSKGHLSSSFFKALLLWLPMAFPITLWIIAENYLENGVEGYIYGDSIPAEGIKTDSDNRDYIIPSGFMIQKDQKKRDFEVDIDTTFRVAFDSIQNEVMSRFLEVKNSLSSLKDDLPSKVGSAIRDSYRANKADLLHVPRNKTFSFSTYKKRRFAKIYNQLSTNLTQKANESMKHSLTEIARSMEGQLQTALTSTNMQLDSVLNSLETQLETKLERARIIATNTVASTYKTYNIIKLILNILLTLAILRSIMYVFARVFYRNNSNLDFSYMNIINQIKGNLVKIPNSYKISGNSTQVYYVKRNSAVIGFAPNLVCPQFNKCVLSRFFTGSYFMNKVDMSKVSRQVKITQEGNKEFIEYNLKKDEKCVFKFNNLVCYSDGVKLNTNYSLSLPSFLVEKNVISVATGPGKIVFTTNGGSIITPENGSNQGVSLTRIIACQGRTRFKVDSNLNVADMYFSEFHLKKNDNSMIVIDGPLSGNRSFGVYRFFVRFLKPI